VEIRLAKKISEEQKEMQIMTGRVAFVIVALIGVSLSLTIAGINMTTLLAAIGFGLSFGLQDIVSNFVAGIYILASRPFTIGDWIQAGGQIGKVEMIGSRATFLKTYDGLRLIVPNSSLFKNNVLSYTSNPLRRLKIPVYTRYYVSLKDVFNICMNVVRSHPNVYLEPKPNMVVVDMADYYMYLELRVWVDSKGLWKRIQSQLFGEIQKKMEEAGMDSPYPVTSLSLEQDAEAYVVKTKTVSDDELKKMIAERELSDAEFSKKREELIKVQQIIQQPQVYDQSGTAFLGAIGTNTPAAQAHPTGQMYDPQQQTSPPPQPGAVVFQPLEPQEPPPQKL
jgi:small-conductance mechanosensitive channel